MTRLAFDTRVRPHTSFARVLALLQHAACEAGIAFEPWGGKKDSSDVLWSPQMALPGVSGPRFVAMLYDVNPLLPDGRGALRRRWRAARFRREVRRCLDATWRIGTCSEDARRRIADAFPAAGERLRVVPLYAAAHFRAEDTDGDDAKHRAAFDLGERYLLYVGALRPHKNWQGLLRAFAFLPKALRHAHPLVLVGRAHRAGRELRRLLHDLHIGDEVQLIEQAPEAALPALYRGAAVFVFPSFAEGFGLPPLEAMACGAPVVASNRTSLPEVLGDAALLVDPGNTEAIADAISRVLTSQSVATDLRTRGLARAAEYNPARTATAMSVLLAEFRP